MKTIKKLKIIFTNKFLSIPFVIVLGLIVILVFAKFKYFLGIVAALTIIALLFKKRISRNLDIQLKKTRREHLQILTELNTVILQLEDRLRKTKEEKVEYIAMGKYNEAEFLDSVTKDLEKLLIDLKTANSLQKINYKKIYYHKQSI